MSLSNKKKSSLNERLELARKHNTSAAEAILGSAAQPLQKNDVAQKQATELEQLMPEGCICNREAKTFVCIVCKMFSFGRIAEMCCIHPNYWRVLCRRRKAKYKSVSVNCATDCCRDCISYACSNVSYLMDFTCCPYCSGPSEHLHMVNMEYGRYFNT